MSNYRARRIVENAEIVVVICAILIIPSASHASPAFDHAADSEYADGWETGDNGGVGFMPWELLFSGVTAPLQQPGPHFLDSAPPLPANALGSPAFGLTTSARQLVGDTSEANRRFREPLAIGETLTIELKGSALNPTVDPFSAGNVVRLLASDDSERFSIFTNNGYQGDNWVTVDDLSTQVPANSAFRFEFTLKSLNTYDFAIRPIAGGAPWFSLSDATLSGTAGGAIDRLAIATYGNGSSADGAFELFFDNIEITGPSSIWNVDGNGNWSSAENWTGGVPNGSGAGAIFGDRITAARTVEVNVPVSVGSIEFNNDNAYTITGANALTLDAPAGDVRISAAQGNHSIHAPVKFANNGVISVSDSGRLSITQLIDASGVTITKNGAGTLQVNGLNAAALAVTDGALAVQSNAGTSVIESLAIAGTAAAPTALLDLNDSALVVDHPSDGASSEASIRAQIISGRGGPGLGNAWDGNGISSSAAATLNAIDPESRSLGYAENATLPLGPYNNFRGQPVDESSILIAFTRTADANLDGVVNDDDVTIVGASYAPGVPQPSWALGDFDYNGFVDDDDVTLLGAFYDPSAPKLSIEAVPEPAGTTLLVLAVAPILAARILKRLRRCQLPG